MFTFLAQDGGLPHVADFVKAHAQMSYFARAARLTRIDITHAQRKDGSLFCFTSFSWFKANKDMYASSGNTVVFDPLTRQLFVFNVHNMHLNQCFLEDDQGTLINKIPSPLDNRDHRHIYDRQIKLREGVPEEDLPFYCDVFRITNASDIHDSYPIVLNPKRLPVPDAKHREFHDCFNKDVAAVFKIYLQTIDADAAACFDDDKGPAFDADIFTWLTQSRDPLICQRRREAFSKSGDLYRALFHIVAPPGNHFSGRRFLAPISELTAAIDSGQDVFKVLSDDLGLPIDFLQNHTKTFGRHVWSIRDDMGNTLRLLHRLPWLTVPPDDFDNRNFFHCHMSAIQRIVDVHQVGDRSWTRVEDGVALRAAILHRTFLPQLKHRMETGDDAPLSWSKANLGFDEISQQIQNGLKDIEKQANILSKHIIAPALSLVKWHTSGTLTEDDFDTADKLAKICIIKLVAAYGLNGFFDPAAFEQTKRDVDEFSAYLLEEDPTLIGNRFFKKYGFPGNDPEIRDAIFKMYRDGPFAYTWPRDLTLPQLLNIAGILKSGPAPDVLQKLVAAA